MNLVICHLYQRKQKHRRQEQQKSANNRAYRAQITEAPLPLQMLLWPLLMSVKHSCVWVCALRDESSLAQRNWVNSRNLLRSNPVRPRTHPQSELRVVCALHTHTHTHLCCQEEQRLPRLWNQCFSYIKSSPTLLYSAASGPTVYWLLFCLNLMCKFFQYLFFLLPWLSYALEFYYLYSLRTFSMRRNNQFFSHLDQGLVSYQTNKKSTAFFIKKWYGHIWVTGLGQEEGTAQHSIQILFSHIFHSHIGLGASQ